MQLGSRSLPSAKKGDETITEKTTLIKYILDAAKDGERWHKMETKVKDCKMDKVRILWEILFETDICDTETLQNKIYEYGSCLKENDHLGREVFIIMAALIKQE
uniref:hypothetical protein n=1 Tax=Agathobacter sp. TaxID=2021311 RepID=UPI004056D910